MDLEAVKGGIIGAYAQNSFVESSQRINKNTLKNIFLEYFENS